MKLPPFSEFAKSVDFEKFGYDIEWFAPQDLKEPSSLFTQEQYTFLTNTMAAMHLALLTQYHQWLSEQIP